MIVMKAQQLLLLTHTTANWDQLYYTDQARNDFRKPCRLAYCVISTRSQSYGSSVKNRSTGVEPTDWCLCREVNCPV